MTDGLVVPQLCEGQRGKLSPFTQVATQIRSRQYSERQGLSSSFLKHFPQITPEKVHVDLFPWPSQIYWFQPELRKWHSHKKKTKTGESSTRR